MKSELVVAVGNDHDERQVSIREPRVMEALLALINHRQRGISALDFNVGVRLGSSIHKLRHRYGIAITSENEPHSSQVVGTTVLGRHSRYKLASTVRVISGADRQAA